MQVRRAPGNAANLQLHQTGLCCSITIADTRRKFDLQESHVRAVQSKRLNDPIIVNFHIASIANQYAEACSAPARPVFVLPSTVFAEWRSKTVTNPISEIAKGYDLSKSEHIAFPFYWESQERWLLVLLASFGDLLGHEDVTVVDAADLNFTFVVLDTQESTTKVQYSPLLRSFRDFTTALLKPRLDVHYAAISGAKLSVPSVPALSPTEYQPLQPGHFLSLILESPEDFIKACRAESFDEEMWDLPARKTGLKRFLSFLAVHSSIAQTNRKWRQLHPAHQPACFVTREPDEGGNDVGRSGDGLDDSGS